MRRSLQIGTIFLILLFVVRLRAQDGEPQLEEFHQRARAEARLDQAFLAMYDLEFGRVDAELERFVADNPGDPRGPAAHAASRLFAIFNQHKVLEIELFPPTMATRNVKQWCRTARSGRVSSLLWRAPKNRLKKR